MNGWMGVWMPDAGAGCSPVNGAKGQDAKTGRRNAGNLMAGKTGRLAAKWRYIASGESGEIECDGIFPRGGKRLGGSTVDVQASLRPQDGGENEVAQERQRERQGKGKRERDRKRSLASCEIQAIAPSHGPSRRGSCSRFGWNVRCGQDATM